MIFAISTRLDLSKALAVAPAELEHALLNRQQYYRNIKLGKPDGTYRLLRVPQGCLKLLQDKVKRHILDCVALPECVHGGVKGRSVRTNARPHVGKRLVFTLDIKDFFPSVGTRTVRAIFGALGFAGEALETLVAVTTWDGQLPQGASTSVALANLAMHRVDVRLMVLCREHGFAYTRYVDDLAFSGSYRLMDFRRLIQRIVGEEGFCINPAKVKTMPAGGRQTVTGIVVNQKLNLPREERRSIRQKVVRIAASSKLIEIPVTIQGHLAWLSSINPAQALRLRRRAFRGQSNPRCN